MSGTLVRAFVFFFVIGAGAIYTTNLEAQTPRATPVRVGEAAPDFTLENQRGYKTTLSESKGKSPVVLVFYRGYW